MKKILTLLRSFLWALLMVTLFNVSGSIIAMEEQALTQEEMGPYPTYPNWVETLTPEEKELYGFQDEEEQIVRMEQALKEGTPNIQDMYGDTPLHIAVRIGDLSTIERLFNAGANPNILNRCGEAPLHVVLLYAGEVYDNIVKLLLEKHADPNIRADGGYTLLHIAANSSETGIVRLLLAKGADPSIQTNSGNTAIDFACSKEMKSLIQGEINLRWALARQAIKEKFETQERDVPELIEKILAYAYPNEAVRRANERQSIKEEDEPGI